jgi:hypothetical protein
MAPVDPRSVITPEAFSVAPHLLGLPLATPGRRLAAMAVDLVVVAFLVNVGGAVLFGLALAWVFFRVASRRGPRVVPRPVRVGAAVLGALVLFGAGTSLWQRAADRMDGDDEAASDTGGERDAARAMQVASRVVGSEGQAGQALRAGAELIALRRSDTEQEAFTHAAAFASGMKGAGRPDAEIREQLADAAAEADGEHVSAAVKRVLAGEGGAVAVPTPPHWRRGTRRRAAPSARSWPARSRRTAWPPCAPSCPKPAPRTRGSRTSWRRSGRAWGSWGGWARWRTSWGWASGGRGSTSPPSWPCGAGRRRGSGCWGSAWCA